MSKKKIFILITALVLLMTAGSFIYYSYFYYVECRNADQNTNAYRMHAIINRYIGDNSSINDIVLSSNKKIEMNNTTNIDIEEVLKTYSQSYNIPYEDGCYYIEIRNGEVYKIIYAKWKYSGFVGTRPEPNGVCKVYQTEVNKALEGFKAYMENK